MSLRTTIWSRKPMTMTVMDTWRFDKTSTDSHKLAFWQTKLPQRTPCPARVFQSSAHSRHLEVHFMPIIVQPLRHCQWLWHQIYWWWAPVTSVHSPLNWDLWHSWRDWTGNLFCGINLDGTMISAGSTLLCRYMSLKISHDTIIHHRREAASLSIQTKPDCLWQRQPSSNTNWWHPSDRCSWKKHIQQIVGTFLYYAWAVDPTILMSLSTITS
jgi:hypothetical protein